MNPLNVVASTDEQIERLLQPTRSSRTLGALTAATSVAGEVALLALAVRRSARGLPPQGILAVASILLVERVGTRRAKTVAGRRRPPDGFRPAVALHPDSASFPSRHASLGFFAARLLSRSTRRRSYLLAALVSLCRLQQGVHTASDLLVGAGVGVAAGAAADRVSRAGQGDRLVGR